MKKIIKSMNYKLKYDKHLYTILKEIQYVVWKIKNESTTRAWDWQQYSFAYKNRLGNYPKDKEKLSKTLQSDIYDNLKALGEDISSTIFQNSIKEAVDKFKTDSKEVLTGNKTIANYRRNGSFPIRSGQIKNIEKITNKKFTCNLGLLSLKKVKELRAECEDKEQAKQIKTQIPVTLFSGGSATSILERIISGEYKLCDSRITQDNKGNFYLSIVYQFEQSQDNTLDKDKIMGIDLGVNIPAMLAISNDKWYKQPVGDGKEILGFQKQMEIRKRRLQQSRKWAGKGSVGHGVKTRIKPLENLSGKIANYKDTKNHNWSRYIVDEAVKNGCGTIQMEDLTGISENNNFLKTWTYYDLQQKITYKAQEVGIEVVKIKPNHTSTRCNRCGFISKENRNVEKNGQDKFICVSCGHGSRYYVNSDENAARNIAMKNIEKIIEEQLRIQERDLKHAMKYEV